MRTLKDVAGPAADIIAERGLARGAFAGVVRKGQCSVCMAGAINEVLTGRPDPLYIGLTDEQIAVMNELQIALGGPDISGLTDDDGEPREFLGDEFDTVYEFSDHAESDDVVVAKLRELAQ